MLMIMRGIIINMNRGGNSQIMAVARYEWQTMLRNRWLAAFALLFAILSGALIYWQYVIYQGESGIGISKPTSILMNLVLQFVPLMSLILSAQSIAGDKGDGMLSLLRSYQLSSLRYITGKWLGLCGAMTLSFVIGIGIPLLISLFISSSSILQILTLFIEGILLIGIFAAIGLWLGGRMKGRMGAISASLVVWFFLVFLYSMIVMVVIQYIPFLWKKPLLAAFLALNPIEAIRIGSVFLQGQGELYGAEFVSWQRTLMGWQGIGIAFGLTLFYLLTPIGMAAKSLKKGEK